MYLESGLEVSGGHGLSVASEIPFGFRYLAKLVHQFNSSDETFWSSSVCLYEKRNEVVFVSRLAPAGKVCCGL